VTAQTVHDIQVIGTGAARHPDMAEIVHAPITAIDDHTFRAEAMEICTGFGRVYAVNHALEIDGFFCLAIDPWSGDRALVYVRGIGIVTDDTELGVIVTIVAMCAQPLVAPVAVIDAHDSPAGCGPGREALDHTGYRHLQVIGAAARNCLHRGVTLDGNGATGHPGGYWDG
jgi:hypothetical protein